MDYPLAELHAHLGTSINPSVYWQIAHESGFKLPKKDYHEFIKYVTLSPSKKMSLKDYFEDIYHPLLDKLSSGTFAVERATYEIMSGAYRNNITLIELRNNPMKHNHEGQDDLDHVIMAMLRGMERALLEYRDLRAGLIFCLGREFDMRKNEVIVEKAIKYHRRGIVGIDIAGPGNPELNMKDYKPLMDMARKAGLKVTVHTGEADDANDMWDVLEHLRPNRIGHGIKAAYDVPLMKELAKRKIVLEVCPLSNIMTKAVADWKEMDYIIKRFVSYKVPFTINTDWPEMIEDAHLYKQFELLLKKKTLTKDQLKKCNATAFEAAFTPLGGLNAYL